MSVSTSGHTKDKPVAWLGRSEGYNQNLQINHFLCVYATDVKGKCVDIHYSY